MGLIDKIKDGIDGAGDTADDVVGGAVEATLDNDVVSVQEGVQYGLGQAQQVGVDISGTGEKMSGSEVAAELGALTDSAFENAGDQLEGTPADNPVTDAAVWTGDAFVRDPAEAFLGVTTGIEVSEEGGSEFEADALDALDLALTAPALKGGKAVIGAARGGRLSGKLGTRLGGGTAGSAPKVSDEVLGAGDDSAQTPDAILGAGEDVADSGATVGDDVVESGTTTVDEVMQALPGGGSSSPSGGALDVFNPRAGAQAVTGGTTRIGGATAGASDDVAAAVSRLADEGAEAGAKATDDVAETGAKVSDDATAGAQAGNDVVEAATKRLDDVGESGAKASDDVAETAAKSSDETAEAADDSGGFLSGITPDLGPKTKGGLLLGGGALGGAAINTAMSDDELPDNFDATDAEGTEYTFVVSGKLEPTDEYPNGATLYAVTQQGTVKGYWVVFGADENGNLILLDESGEQRQSNITPTQFENSLPGASSGGGQ